MTHSMTGFAAATGQQDDWHWSWELRSVNGRGLDLRLRIPDWIEGLEPALRSTLQKAIARGSVSLSLRVTREVGSDDAAISPDGLDRALRQIEAVETAAMDRGMTLKPATAADIKTEITSTVSHATLLIYAKPSGIVGLLTHPSVFFEVLENPFF